MLSLRARFFFWLCDEYVYVGVHIVRCACRIRYDRMKLHCLLGLPNKMYNSARYVCVEGL